jgi:hypothetical protein
MCCGPYKAGNSNNNTKTAIPLTDHGICIISRGIHVLELDRLGISNAFRNGRGYISG